MTDVVINGTRYVPETTNGTPIGIGVTTRNRNKHTGSWKPWAPHT